MISGSQILEAETLRRSRPKRILYREKTWMCFGSKALEVISELRKVENFSSLYQDKLISLQRIYNETEGKGVKTQIEDDMVGMYNHTTFNLNPRASSIDTPLHSFIPAKHVDHMHPNAFISICAS